MKTRIMELREEGKIVRLENNVEFIIEYFDIEKVKSMKIGTELELKEIDDLFWPFRLNGLGKEECARLRALNYFELIPKDKFDFDTVNKLENTDINKIKYILPDLFEWIVDPNWPIAKKLAQILAGLDEMIIPYIRYFLNHPQCLDEYAVYYVLLPMLSNKVLKLIKCDLERIANNPTEFEKEEEYDEIAKKYLEKIKYQK